MARTRDDVLTILRRQKPALEQQFGVRKIGVFGSIARGEAAKSSDVDVVVDMPADLYRMVHLKELLEELLDAPVDLVRYHDYLVAPLRARIDREAKYA